MKYQLVALFDDNSYPELKELQKRICRKYKLYKNTPTLYVPLNTISNVNASKIEHVLSKVLTPYKQFKVKINNTVNLDENNKSVRIDIDNKGYLFRIARNITDSLNDYGIKTNINSSEDLSLYIPIANSNYNIKKACARSNEVLIKGNLQDNFLQFAKIDKIELWKMNGNRKESVVKSFTLRPY